MPERFTLLILPFLVLPSMGGERPSTIDFARDVAPLFARHCVACHGDKKQRGGLRLDRRPDALLARIVVPGKSTESRLFQLVSGRDTGERMPPEGPPLTMGELEVIRNWIDSGAKWPTSEEEHWSLRRLQSPAVPHRPGVQHPIDAFVRVKLAQQGLSPSAPADRRTLIRRLTYNLHGLPPTPEEVRDFENDPSPQAYEKLIERLLASPRYGERWARHWMDIAHFAETHGHDQDSIRENAWPYRDYLIRAFNSDLPYSRFVQEQLAGDVLGLDGERSIAALGFLSAGPWDESSQKDIRDDTLDKKQAQYIDRDDMLTTVFTALASTSIHCARCHDHKFDPISQKEYYGLQAIFAGVERANRDYDPDPAVGLKRGELLRRKEAILAGRVDLNREKSAVDAWAAEASKRVAIWKPLSLEAKAQSSKLERLPDGSLLSAGPRPEKDVYTFSGRNEKPISAIRLEVLTDPSLPKNGPGRQDNGNLHLSEIRVRAGGKDIPVSSASADFNQAGWDITRAIDGDPTTAWGIYPEVGKPHQAVFVLKQTIPAGEDVVIELHQLHGGGHLIGRVRLSGTAVDNPGIDLNPLPSEILAILETEPVKRTSEQQAALDRHYLLGVVERELAALPKVQMVYAAANRFEAIGSFKPPAGPRAVHVLKRGDITRPGELAEPSTLSCVSGPTPLKIAEPSNEAERRVALARWMTDRENGLVWRSIVNRVWHYHFGRGIVNTPNDFGRMGAVPTHPELLDWLAVWFRDRGGSLKDLHRLILTSQTYRQAVGHRPDQSKKDAENAYLWRMNRTRLDAESVRDAILSVSGQLDSTMGGPSARHFTLAPGVHVTPVVNYDAFDLDSPAARRRSVYRFVFRTLPDPFYEALDCPDASQFTPVRAQSITALQALAMMNDRFAVRYAEHFAARLQREHSVRERQIERAYRLALSRPPTESEVQQLSEFANRHGLANACRVLLNSNEFLFVD